MEYKTSKDLKSCKNMNTKSTWDNNWSLEMKKKKQARK